MTSQFFIVYVLLSLKDNKFYVGYTENLKQRLIEHEKGHVHSTAHRKPLQMIHFEGFINKADAKAREVFLKSGYGREQLRLSLKRTLDNFI